MAWCRIGDRPLSEPMLTRFSDAYMLQWKETSQTLTHWGRATHICFGNLIIIDSDNGLSPGRRQAIIWTNAGLLLIGTLETHFSEILIEIQTFSFKKLRLKVSSAKWWPFCLGLNVLNRWKHMSAYSSKTPGHQYPQCWLNIHCIGPVSYSYITVLGNRWIIQCLLGVIFKKCWLCYNVFLLYATIFKPCTWLFILSGY